MASATGQSVAYPGLQGLDRGELPGAWVPWIARALGSLWEASPPADRLILAPLGSFLAEHRDELALVRSRSAKTPPKLPERSYQSLPIATTLLQYRERVQPLVMTRLTAILVAARLETGLADVKGRNRVELLATVLRGAYADEDSQLRILFSDASSIPALIHGYEAYARTAPSGDTKLVRFNNLWIGWIRDTLLRWIRADTEAVSDSLRIPLAPDLDGSSLPMGGEGMVDSDSAPDVEIYLVDEEPVQGDLGPRIRQLKAEASAYLRSSPGDLLLPVDQIAPADLVTGLMRKALKTAHGFLHKGDVGQAEPPAALALSAATGLRELDLAAVVWGTEETASSLVLDIEHPILYRPVFRPPNAVKPAGEVKPLLSATTDVIRWPLPPSVHKILLSLAPAASPAIGAAVLPVRSLSFSRAYRLWDVAIGLMPEVALAPTQIRLALASELAHVLGSEVAQLALADTFSTSAAPGYYSAPLERELGNAVAQIQERWFGEVVPVPADRQRSFGSLLVLTPETARMWPELLRRRIRSGAHRKGHTTIEEWVAHRDHLAAALCAATGSRPFDELGRINLDQIVPEYGLIVLRDKASDVLRLTRVAATGRRWVADLRVFLDRLQMIAEGNPDGPGSALAGRILRAEAPLFSVPEGTDGARSFTAAQLTASMPEALRSVPNHYRHRLNQSLQRKGVDPELRHAQLGWVVSPAHAMANLSHWSPKAFAAEMADALDDFLCTDGWYPASQKVPAWTWEGLPTRPFQDWEALTKAHLAEHEANVRRLRNDLGRRWQELSPDVLRRLSEAVGEYFPRLTVDVATRRLERAPRHRSEEAVELRSDDYGLLWDRARQGDKHPDDALEAVIARILLHRMVRNARKKGIVKGPNPSRPYLRGTSEPSPFLPSLGLAVRHAEAVREELLARASLQRDHDNAPLAVLSVIAFSPYRSIALATAAVHAATESIRSVARDDCLRVPAVVDGRLVPLVFSGLAAVAIARRGAQAPSGRAPTREQLSEWLRLRLKGMSYLRRETSATLDGTVELFRAAGRLELSGQERLAFLDGTPVGSVPIERSLARDDSWPLRTATPKPGKAVVDTDPTYEEEAQSAVPADHGPQRRTLQSMGYSRLIGLLSPEGLAKVAGGKSDGHFAWRKKLEKHLSKLHQEFGQASNLGLLIGFARHRLRYGGAAKSELAHVTLGSDLTRFAADLLAVSGDETMVEWDEAQFRQAYLAVLLGKPVTARRQSFDALVVFHYYLVQVHHAPEISFAELEPFAGQRMTFLDPGLFTDAEKERVLAVLHQDLETECGQPDADPETIRCLELRVLLFLILEASAVRPRSAHGLTLGDLLLAAPGRDFVRIRLTGEYGHAKTARSTGFIPLSGGLWEASRDWVLEWLSRERARLAGTDWWRRPVFASRPGSGRRFGLGYLTRRFDELLKWVSSNRKACTYWLRKSRINARHEAVVRVQRPMARDVHAALRASGHADIDTPMASYIGEPAVANWRHLHDGLDASRADILDISGLSPAPLDMAWSRGGASTLGARLASVLARLGSKTADPAAELLTEPPPLRRAATLSPQNIYDYALAMHKYGDRREAIVRTGITSRQAGALDSAARAMLVRKGRIPWPVADLRSPRAVLPPPRRLDGTDALFKLLQSAPSPQLCLLAEHWLVQANLELIHEPQVILELPDDATFEAAQFVIAKTGIDLLFDRKGGVRVLRAVENVDRSKGHGPAFRWVLAMTWLHGQLIAAV